MVLTQGTRYRARIRLGLFEQIASNDAIREKLEEAGFTAVGVGGSGRDRYAEGTWDLQTQNADLPDQVVSSSVEAI